MQRVVVAGGGLAGLASAAALGGAGFEVDLHEMRPFLGGRATSYHLPTGGEEIDNCQHILLRCCVNLLDFYGRLGAEGCIDFHSEFHFIEPGGRISHLKAGLLPTPFHFAESFLKMHCLSLGEKVALGRGVLALKRERKSRRDLDEITMLQWLQEKGQPPRVIERFWRQVLVSAINEELDRMAASHGFQVFCLGFLASRNSYEMGVPAVPLGELYRQDRWRGMANVRLHLKSTVERFCIEDGVVKAALINGEHVSAEAFISSLPFERLGAVLPEIALPLEHLEHSPITGIHLWFDRPVTSLPHGTLLDRTLQWFFTKEDGRYLQLVISASRSLLPMGRREVIDMGMRELPEFLPEVAKAKLLKAHVVKEARATFSAKPGLEAHRPEPLTQFANFFLAGDWTRSGWPATMEGAVRSGYRAAEAASAMLGRPAKFLLPDIA